MDGSAIDKIREAIEASFVTKIGGEVYSAKPLHRVYDDARPSTVQVRTLTGLADYMKTEGFLASVSEIPYFVNVVDHSEVKVLTEGCGESNQRSTLISCKLNRPSFEFGRWYESEEFVIKLSSLFEVNDALGEVISYAGKLKIDTEVNIQDDGVSQVASVKKGISGGMTEKKKAPGRVRLVPFRTFSEVEQPSSEFVFRVRQNGGSAELALFEADGGMWKNTAADNVKSWLQKTGINCPILA